MQRALETLVTALERAPRTAVGALDILPEAERTRLVVQWNATRAPYPTQPIHELFEAQVARSPDALAVIAGAQRVTYGELNRRANQLARALQRHGVVAGTRVALSLERSVELVVAELAILKCGGVYVPLDDNAPLERQRFIVDDCQAQLVLSREVTLGSSTRAS
jgi:non-ribosomal peptide synthetase component F